MPPEYRTPHMILKRSIILSMTLAVSKIKINFLCDFQILILRLNKWQHSRILRQSTRCQTKQQRITKMFPLQPGQRSNRPQHRQKKKIKKRLEIRGCDWTVWSIEDRAKQIWDSTQIAFFPSSVMTLSAQGTHHLSFCTNWPIRVIQKLFAWLALESNTNTDTHSQEHTCARTHTDSSDLTFISFRLTCLYPTHN